MLLESYARWSPVTGLPSGVQVQCLRSRWLALHTPPWRVEEDLVTFAKLGFSDLTRIRMLERANGYQGVFG